MRELYYLLVDSFQEQLQYFIKVAYQGILEK